MKAKAERFMLPRTGNIHVALTRETTLLTRNPRRRYSHVIRIEGMGKRYVLRMETRAVDAGVSGMRTLFAAGLGLHTDTAKEYDLRPGTTVIGKGSSCAVCLKHPTISRRHAEILNDGGALYITDLHSLNGVFVDGEMIPPGTPWALKEGAAIIIGKIELRIVPRDG